MPEPISAQELADHLRVELAGQEEDLERLIEMARDTAEEITGRDIIRKQRVATFDAISCVNENWWSGQREGIERARRSNAIELPRAAPLVSVDRFTTYANDDTATDADLSIFIVDKADPNRLGRLVLRDGQVWPEYTRPTNAIEITYTTGWTPDTVPPGLKRAIMAMAAWLYSNRGDCSDQCADACGATMLMARYRLVNL